MTATVASLAHRAALLLAAILLMAASPRSFGPLASADTLPLPPKPPAAADPATFSAFAPAPVPNFDEEGVTHKSSKRRVELTPGFFRQQEGVSGDGFTPNSSIFREQTKRLLPTPGLNLNVPLN